MLENYARDHPERMTFTRSGAAAEISELEVLVANEAVLRGAAHEAMMAPRMPSSAVRARAAQLAGAGAALRSLATPSKAEVISHADD
jgi:hypothetical protein